MARDPGMPEARGLVPPRPNLGPEPWAEDSGRPSIVGLSILGLAVLMALAWWWRRSRRPSPGRPGLEAEPTPVVELDPSPRSRLIASAKAVRSAIVATQGPAWASKTTEELADEPELLRRLGVDQSARLVDLLRASDRAKFAGEDPERVEDWEAWAGEFLGDWSAGAAPKDRGRSSGDLDGRPVISDAMGPNRASGRR